MTLNERLQALGWERLEGATRDKRLGNIAPHGDGQLRKGPVTLSLSNGALYDGKHGATYYHDAGLVLNAIVVEADHRGKGLARAAMADLAQALEGSGAALYLEPSRIGGAARFKGGLTDAQLRTWYERHGFVPASPSCTRCLRRDFPAGGEA